MDLRSYDTSWPLEATSAFERAIEAHGGWQAWDAFETIDLKLIDFSGLLPLIKGLGKTFFAPQLLRIDPKNRLAEFSYGSHTDIYDDGKLIFSPQKQVAENGRRLFKGSTFEKWQPEHSLYFFGYAWSNYMGYPFILPKFSLLSWKDSGPSSEFTIRFPGSFHTHSAIQTFYFDSSHLLFRHDYRADIAGSIFYAAHFTEGYEEFDGIKIACIRKVRPRFMKISAPLYGIYAKLEVAS